MSLIKNNQQTKKNFIEGENYMTEIEQYKKHMSNSKLFEELSNKLNLIKKPEKVAFSIVSKEVDVNPISSIVSDVRVKNTSPSKIEYLSLSSKLESILPLGVFGKDIFLYTSE